MTLIVTDLNLRRAIYFCCISLVPLLLLATGMSGCAPDAALSTVPATRTLAATPTLIAPPKPEYIQNVWPEPGSAVLLEKYIAQERLREDFWSGAPFVPPDSNICVALDFEPLAVMGDTKEDDSTLNERMHLEVDGEVISEEFYGEWLLTENYFIYGGTRTYFGAPGAVCWQAIMGEGVHDVTFHFEQTNGVTHEYAWQFVIVDEGGQQTPAPANAGSPQ